MSKVFALAEDKIKKIDHPSFRVGDVIRVHRRVKEGDKERIQIIEGEVIALKHGKQPGSAITLRRVTLGVGVELIFPLYSPQTEKIEIVKKQKVKKAKLYYIKRAKKKIKLKEDREALVEIQKAEEEKQKKIVEKKKKEEAKEEAKKTEEVKEEKKETAKKEKQPEVKKEAKKVEDKETKEKREK